MDEEEEESSCASSCDSHGAILEEVRPSFEHTAICNEQSACRKFRGLIEDEGIDRLYPPLDGTAFYSNICHINHSCVPNVIVKYISTTDLGLLANVVALRSISEGEELVQSYIDSDLGNIDTFIILLHILIYNAVRHTKEAERASRLWVCLQLFEVH